MLIMWGLYYVSLLSSVFVKSALGYSMLLIMSSCFVSLMIYLILGLAWYSILIFLMYVGGVYILFLFISLHIPNNFFSLQVKKLFFFYVFFLIWEILQNLNFKCFLFSEYSFYLCSFEEGSSYLYLSCFLVTGFMLISFMSSSKECFLR